MCKRKQPADPLVKQFLERYHLNLLPIPRRDAVCGQLFVRRPGKGGRLGAVGGTIDALVEPSVELPPVHADEPLAPLEGTLSGGVSVGVGINLLGGFLAAVGVPPGIVDEVRAGYERKGTRSFKFAFGGVTRDSMDPFSLGGALVDHRFREQHPWLGEGNRYFVSAAVVRARSIVVHAEDETATAIDVGAGLAKVIDADASLKVDRRSTGDIEYSGDELAIGLELYDLHYDAEAGGFQMGAGDVSVDLRFGRQVDLEPAFPAEDDEALLDVEDLS